MDVSAVVERLRGLTLNALRARYQEVFGNPHFQNTGSI
jgi:hypothetical protein